MAAEETGLIYGWCWADPVCLSFAASVVSSLAAMARRLDTIEEWSRGKKRGLQIVKHLAAGSVTSGIASFGICLIGVLSWPTQNKIIAALVIVVGVFLDWSTDSGKKTLRTLALAAMPSAIRDWVTRSFVEGETTEDAKHSK